MKQKKTTVDDLVDVIALEQDRRWRADSLVSGHKNLDHN